ncbi:MAG: DUF551 domain-containing protein [Alphaproteobacteria bacterium]
MIDNKQQRCANCRYFCQDVDPESRLYFDEKSGECRRRPPHNNFSWWRTRSYHWCGEWEERADIKKRAWQRLSAHPRNEQPVLLYKRGALCKQSGMIVAYWNAAFSKWHDDGDRLFEYGEFTNWMDLPEPPEF